jgi:hypothetical protein
MENTFNYIHYKTITYPLNQNSGYYEKQPTLVGFNKIPNELKVEETQKDIIRQQGANEIIRGRIKNNKYTFLTGLIPLYNSTTVYFGNNYEYVGKQKKTSLIVFKFSDSNRMLDVYYFNNFYKDNRNERIDFVNNFITTIG